MRIRSWKESVPTSQTDSPDDRLNLPRPAVQHNPALLKMSSFHSDVPEMPPQIPRYDAFGIGTAAAGQPSQRAAVPASMNLFNRSENQKRRHSSLDNTTGFNNLSVGVPDFKACLDLAGFAKPFDESRSIGNEFSNSAASVVMRGM